MLADLDADEADVLHAAIERMHVQAAAMAKETAALDAKARELLRIAEEEKRLLTDARSYLDRLRQRSEELAEEYLRVMGRQLVPAR